MQITIAKHIFYKNDYRLLLCNGYERRAAHGCTWPYMVGEVARFALTGVFPPVGLLGDASEYDDILRITEDYGGGWCIEHDGCFMDRLNFDEMLGTIAKFTLTGRQSYGGFRSYESWIAACGKWYSDRPICALLTCEALA